MVRMPLFRTLNREFASSNPTGVPKVHCTPSPIVGFLKSTALLPSRGGLLKSTALLPSHPGVRRTLGTLAREETDFKNKFETTLETMRSEVLNLENQVGVIRDVMLDNISEMSDDKAKIEDQTQILDSVTQRIAQTETFLEDITSKVSMLEFDISNVRGMLLDDENKIENQTQTLDSVTQRVSQTETFLEDITSKVSMLESDVRTVRGWLLDDGNKIETRTQTLDAVTQ